MFIEVFKFSLAKKIRLLGFFTEFLVQKSHCRYAFGMLRPSLFWNYKYQYSVSLLANTAFTFGVKWLDSMHGYDLNCIKLVLLHSLVSALLSRSWPSQEIKDNLFLSGILRVSAQHRFGLFLATIQCSVQFSRIGFFISRSCGGRPDLQGILSGTKVSIWVPETWNHHHWIPFKYDILIYVSHLGSSSLPSWATRWTRSGTCRGTPWCPFGGGS